MEELKYIRGENLPYFARTRYGLTFLRHQHHLVPIFPSTFFPCYKYVVLM